jgi:DNA-binding CsgD family transcriptional regulator
VTLKVHVDHTAVINRVKSRGSLLFPESLEFAAPRSKQTAHDEKGRFATIAQKAALNLKKSKKVNASKLQADVVSGKSVAEIASGHGISKAYAYKLMVSIKGKLKDQPKATDAQHPIKAKLAAQAAKPTGISGLPLAKGVKSIEEMHASGASVGAIAKAHGKSYQSVYQKVKKLGSASVSGNIVAKPRQELNKILDMSKQGYSTKDIAKKQGVPESKVLDHIAANLNWSASKKSSVDSYMSAQASPSTIAKKNLVNVNEVKAYIHAKEKAAKSTTGTGSNPKLQLGSKAEQQKHIDFVGAATGKSTDALRPMFKPGTSGGNIDKLDIGELTVVKQLGGSTGARLMKDKGGNQFVQKFGNNPGHLREESYADKAYEAAGVPVPKHAVFNTGKGPMKIAEFHEGQSLASVLKGKDENLKQSVIKQLQKHFAVDVALGNWDVVGMGHDNVLVDKQGRALRIDNGGSLRYRAQGAKKTAAQFDEHPSEIKTLRDPKVNPQTARIFRSMTDSDIAASVASLVSRKSKVLAALPPELRDVVGKRIDNLAKAYPS